MPITTKLGSWMLVVALAASALVVLLAAPASATLSEEAFEACLLERINDSRVDEGLNELEMALDLNPLTREWSEYMATHNDFRHMTPAERDPFSLTAPTPGARTSPGMKVGICPTARKSTRCS